MSTRITATLRDATHEGITAFLGRSKVGIRYANRVTCLECSVKLDPRDLAIDLEVAEDHSQDCEACSSPI
jgi:hypothetical protein